MSQSKALRINAPVDQEFDILLEPEEASIKINIESDVRQVGRYQLAELLEDFLKEHGYSSVTLQYAPRGGGVNRLEIDKHNAIVEIQKQVPITIEVPPVKVADEPEVVEYQSAQEMCDLATTQGINNAIVLIHDEISGAAHRGLMECHLTTPIFAHVSMVRDELNLEDESFIPSFTPLQERVVVHLRQLGYSVIPISGNYNGKNIKVSWNVG